MQPTRFDNQVAPVILLAIIAGLALLHFWEDAALLLVGVLVLLFVIFGLEQFFKEL